MRMMAINQFYHPDLSATSQLLTQLCEDLVRAGDEVTVVASRGSYMGQSAPLPDFETIEGVRVIRAWASSLGKRSLLHRVSDYGSFWLTSIAAAIRAARPDVILVLTTPPLIPVGAAMVSLVRDVPLVSWVQDIYPDLAVRLGVLPEKHPAVSALHTASVLAHRRSRLSVALSDGMARHVSVHGQVDRGIRGIPNWADGESLKPVPPPDNQFRAAHDLEGKFVVMYSGNHALGHDVETLIEAARHTEKRCPDVVYRFVGGGARVEEAKRLAQGLTNVQFLPYQPLERLAESLSAADVHLASLRSDLEGLLVPSKLYGVLAVGRPLFYVGPPECEVAQVVNREKVGWTGKPGDAQGLANAIERAAANREETTALGQHARAVFDREYDRRHAVRRWRDVLQEAVEG